MVVFGSIALFSLHARGSSLRQHSRQQARSSVLTIIVQSGSYDAGSPTAVVCSREMVSCGNRELYAVVEWMPAVMLVQCAHWIFVFYLSNWVVVSLFLRDVGGSFRWRELLPTALTVSTSFHLYRYHSTFIALLLRVIVLLLPRLAPSPGVYYIVSDDRVPRMIPDHSNTSKSEVVRYRRGLPQVVSWPGCLKRPYSLFRKFS